jgi:2-dehydropantoate 2-reductase
MRIHIVGAGAIGGMAGAYMALSGEDVTFVDRWREHVLAMREDGLHLAGVRGEARIPVRALSPDDLDEPLELVFLAVKSQHTEEAVGAIAPHLTSTATVVSLQNGMNEDRIAALIGRERVVGALPDYTAALVEPGRLEFTVEGPVYVGELDGADTERLRRIAGLLATLTRVEPTRNIIGRIWTKQCYMCQIVMTALVDASANEVLRSERYALLGVALVREAIAIADHAGVALERDAFFQPDLIRRRTPAARREQLGVMRELMAHFAREGEERRGQDAYRYVKTGSGIWWDIVYRRRRSETRWLTGELVARAGPLGVPTPLNSALVELIYAIERGERPLGQHNLDELAAIAEAHGEPLAAEDDAGARR